MMRAVSADGLLWLLVLPLTVKTASTEADRVQTDENGNAVRWIKSNSVTEVDLRRSVKSLIFDDEESTESDEFRTERAEESRLRRRRALFSASDVSSIVDAHNSVRSLEGAANMELMVNSNRIPFLYLVCLCHNLMYWFLQTNM